MTLLSTAQHLARDTRKNPRSPIVLILVAAAITAAAIALVCYLLWPTWGAPSADAPSRLPVSVGATLFNVPTAAVRMKIQRHSGPQERVDLGFVFPRSNRPRRRSTSAPRRSRRRCSRSTAYSCRYRPIAIRWRPTARVRTIYPRYLEQNSTPVEDGLTMRAFRDGSPYASEDLFSASAPGFNARCTRDGRRPACA